MGEGEDTCKYTQLLFSAFDQHGRQPFEGHLGHPTSSALAPGVGTCCLFARVLLSLSFVFKFTHLTVGVQV